MKKQEARRIIVDCARIYKEELLGKNLLFAFKEKSGDISYEEMIFQPRHFLHLTGVKLKRNSNIKSSVDFFNMCLKNKLSIDDFEFDSNGTTTLKLQVLPTSMKIQKTARMIGNYNHTKVKLYTEKIVGNIYAGIGFVKENGYYVPNTLLKDDSRNLLSQSNQIIAVFSKKRDQQLYDTVVYCGKINDLKAILPQIIINKIDIETLFPSDSIEGTKLTIS